jgi:hypothetical protein
MASPRSRAAIDRIDAALRRIEAAGPQSAPVPNHAQADLAHLAARHDALRDEAKAALSALDTLIGNAR